MQGNVLILLGIVGIVLLCLFIVTVENCSIFEGMPRLSEIVRKKRKL